MTQLSSRPLDVLGTFTQLRHSNITFLSLAECGRIREHELRALRTLTRLQSLNLNFTGIGGRDPIPACRQLAAHLATPRCALTRLEVAGTAIHGAGLVALLQGLETNTSLVFLRLQENPIGDSGAFALANFVAATTTVKRIPLGPMGNVGLLSRGTRIGQTGLDALAVALVKIIMTSTSFLTLFFSLRSPPHGSKCTNGVPGNGVPGNGVPGERALHPVCSLFRADWRAFGVGVSKSRASGRPPPNSGGTTTNCSTTDKFYDPPLSFTNWVVSCGAGLF